jgi:tetratricopeptide (TPR) repeat protein
MGPALDDEVRTAESLSRQGDWNRVRLFWECVRSLSMMLHGPADIRPWAALSRLARSVAELSDEAETREKAASLARGALEGLRKAEGDPDVLELESAFASGTLKMASVGEREAVDGEQRASARNDEEVNREGPTSAWNDEEVNREGPTSALNDEEVNREGPTSAWDDEKADWEERVSGLEGEGDDGEERAFARDGEEDGEERASVHDGDDEEDGGDDDVDAWSHPDEKFHEVPARVSFTLNATTLPFHGNGWVLLGSRSVLLSPPRRDLGRLREMVAESESKRGGRWSPKTHSLRSELGDAIAYEIASRALRGPLGNGAAPGVGPGEPAGEPEGPDLEDTAYARKLLTEASEALDRKSPTHPRALDAKERLMRFLMGESGPVRVLRPVAEEFPPEKDLKKALSLARSIRRDSRKEKGGVLENFFRPDGMRRVEMLLSAARCLSRLGHEEGAVKARMKAREESNYDPKEIADKLPPTLYAAQLVHELAESAFDEESPAPAGLLYQKALATFGAALGGAHRLTLQTSVRLADTLTHPSERLHRASLLARAAETLEARWPLDPDIPELRFMAATDFMFLDEHGTVLPFLRRMAEVIESVLGWPHPRVVRAVFVLGRVLLDAGEFLESEAAFRRVAEHMDTVSRPRKGAYLNESLHATVLGQLGLALLNSGNFREALDYFTLEMEKMTKLSGPDSPETLEAEYCRALALYGMGDPDRALSIQRKVLASRKRVLGPFHSDTKLSSVTVRDLESRL